MFDYTFDDGTSVEVPDFKVKFGTMRKNRGKSEEEQSFLILESILDDETLAVIDDYDSVEVSKFVEAWSEAAQGSKSE